MRFLIFSLVLLFNSISFAELPVSALSKLIQPEKKSYPLVSLEEPVTLGLFCASKTNPNSYMHITNLKAIPAGAQYVNYRKMPTSIELEQLVVVNKQLVRINANRVLKVQLYSPELMAHLYTKNQSNCLLEYRKERLAPIQVIPEFTLNSVTSL